MGGRLTGMIVKVIDRFTNGADMRRRLRTVYVCTEQSAEQRYREMYTGIVKRILLVLVLTIILAGTAVLAGNNETDAVTLSRQGYGGEAESVELSAEIDGEEQTFEVEVLPLEYDESELDRVFEQGFQYIDAEYLGDNESAEQVYCDLTLTDSIDSLGLDVSWTSDDDDTISSDGEFVAADPELDKLVTLTAVLSYGDSQAERDYVVRARGTQPSAREQAVTAITEYIRKLQLENRSDAELTLPERIAGYIVTDGTGGESVAVILLLGAFCAVAVWVRAGSQLAKRERRRKDELIQAYPGLVDRLCLYLEAGLTVRGSFDRIVKNAENRGEAAGQYPEAEKRITRRCGKNKDKTPDADGEVLETELKYTLNEIHSGISEEEAYCNLGRRLDLPVYVKLMTLLSRNVSKGNRDLLYLMAEEEQSALQMRRETAKKKGEEAGTRLLFPMIVLLAAVMAIVIVPAVMSF